MHVPVAEVEDREGPGGGVPAEVIEADARVRAEAAPVHGDRDAVRGHDVHDGEEVLSAAREHAVVPDHIVREGAAQVGDVLPGGEVRVDRLVEEDRGVRAAVVAAPLPLDHVVALAQVDVSALVVEVHVPPEGALGREDDHAVARGPDVGARGRVLEGPPAGAKRGPRHAGAERRIPAWEARIEGDAAASTPALRPDEAPAEVMESKPLRAGASIVEGGCQASGGDIETDIAPEVGCGEWREGRPEGGGAEGVLDLEERDVDGLPRTVVAADEEIGAVPGDAVRVRADVLGVGWVRGGVEVDGGDFAEGGLPGRRGREQGEGGDAENSHG